MIFALRIKANGGNKWWPKGSFVFIDTSGWSKSFVPTNDRANATFFKSKSAALKAKKKYFFANAGAELEIVQFKEVIHAKEK